MRQFCPLTESRSQNLLWMDAYRAYLEHLAATTSNHSLIPTVGDTHSEWGRCVCNSLMLVAVAAGCILSFSERSLKIFGVVWSRPNSKSGFVKSRLESSKVVRSHSKSYGVVRSDSELSEVVWSHQDIEIPDHLDLEMTWPRTLCAGRCRLTPDDSNSGEVRTTSDNSGWLRFGMTPDNSGNSGSDFAGVGIGLTIGAVALESWMRSREHTINLQYQSSTSSS